MGHPSGTWQTFGRTKIFIGIRELRAGNVERFIEGLIEGIVGRTDDRAAHNKDALPAEAVFAS